MDTVQGADKTPTGQHGPLLEPDADASLQENAMIAAPTPTYIPSSPPAALPRMPRDAESDEESRNGAKSDSEAETVLLPGVDGYSPSKSRKVKLEDKADDVSVLDFVGEKVLDAGAVKSSAADQGATSTLGKRKRIRHGSDSNGNHHSRNRTGNSSGLSSIPTSPVATTRSSLSKPADSESDASRSSSPRRTKKARSVEQESPSREDSRLQQEKERLRNRRNLGSGREQTDNQGVSRHNEKGYTRSASPTSLNDRRSSSQQPFGGNAVKEKKKKISVPLRASKDRHNMDQNSDDESSTGESTHPRRSQTRNLATPPTGESAASLANMGKKRRRQFGSSFLATACEHGDLKKAKDELDNKPEDLDHPDNAGNTPLQVAALNGHADICTFLIDRGCDIHCSNSKKETPLLDAAENGHLDVVKVLLEAGVNPRAKNHEGDMPIDKVDDDHDEANAIRQALNAAASRYVPPPPGKNGRQPVAEAQPESNSSLRNPRYTSHSRARKTDESQLFVKLDVNQLRTSAAAGDVETVMRILEVIGETDDPEATVNAARGGHYEVLNLLMALGGASRDPEPLQSRSREYATPILVALGGDRFDVVKLFLDGAEDGTFDPTRKHNGKSYIEIAEGRRGPYWELEVEAIEKACRQYKPPVSSRRTASGSQKSSSKRDNEGKDRGNGALSKPARISVPGHKRDRANSSADNPTPTKRGPGRPRREERDLSPDSDRDTPSKSTQLGRHMERDSTAGASETEPSKPRRKLISGKDLKGERQRRTSIASVKSTTSMAEGGERDQESRDSTKTGGSNKPKLMNSTSDSTLIDKSLERARSQKRDGSKDRLSAIRGDSPTKRPRTSPTPPAELHSSQSAAQSDERRDDKTHKRRRLDEDRRPGSRVRESSESPEHPMGGGKGKRPLKRDESPDAKRPIKKQALGAEDENMNPRRVSAKHDHEQDAGRDNNKRKSATPPEKSSEAKAIELRVAKEKAEKAERERKTKQETLERQKREAEALRLVQEVKLEEEARLKRVEKERVEKMERLEKERLEAIERQEREERAKKEKAEADRLEAVRLEQRRREEVEAQARAELERKRILAEQQRLRREEQERRKAEQEAAQQRMLREQEKARLSKLPPLIRWFDQCPLANTPETARLFRVLQGVRYDTIISDVSASADSREQWLLNTQVALLLGEKDLQLSRYTAWERLPAGDLAKKTLWKALSEDYSMISESLRHLNGDVDPIPVPKLSAEARNQSWPLFQSLDMFFVKVSDLMYIIPNFPHLRNLELRVVYRELPPNELWLLKPTFPPKWKTDIGGNKDFCPGMKYYVNGKLLKEDAPKIAITSNRPFPFQRVPRLDGIHQVYPTDPQYEQLCREQGLDHLLPRAENGMTPPDSTASLEERRLSASSSSHSAPNGLSNGENGIS